jgi:hypothetical protein
MPNSEATARGHLRKSPKGQPHQLSDSVSARQRSHKAQIMRQLLATTQGQTIPGATNEKNTLREVFDPTKVPRSITLHLDYTGALPKRCASGTLYFMVSCWGHYIHIEPLSSLQGPHTSKALTKTIHFFCSKKITLQGVRMDNQSSNEIRAATTALGLLTQFVSAHQKEPNRAERAIQTAKNHLSATRAGFHIECPHSLLDKCLVQIEMTLNIIHSFEYDPSISAYHGVHGETFDFMRHPIAPAGPKVLTWNSPDNRGSWDDHGYPGVYRALQHFRAFRIWVPQTSAMRVSATFWWFFPSLLPDANLIALQDTAVSYPPTRHRPHPQSNGGDLVGRFFFQAELGVCCITRLGSVTEKRMQSCALRVVPNSDTPIPLGSHHTLYYKCVASGEEHNSSLDEILEWIRTGPILQAPLNPCVGNPQDYTQQAQPYDLITS